MMQRNVRRTWAVVGGLIAGAALVVSLQSVAGAADKPVPPPPPLKSEPKGPRAIIKTKHGEIEIKLRPDLAPKTVENFVKLAKEGFFDGTTFHRVIPGFMIQGGDPLTKDSRKKDQYGTGGPGYTIKGEFSDTPHKRGMVSMARRGESGPHDTEALNSGGSQFFIVVEDSRFLDRKYAVFGEVVRGMGVADKIVNEPRDEKDNPKTRVEMTVKVVE